jgi:hypothetical protein
MAKKKKEAEKPNFAAIRAHVFEEMLPPLQAVAVAFDKEEGTRTSGTLLIAWREGNTLRKVIEQDAVYGSQAVEQLAKYLNTTTTHLYTLRTFALEYTREDLKAIGDRMTSDGGRLVLGHLTAIMGIKSQEQRKTMLERAFEESLSVNELQSEIKAVCEPKNARSGGRKPGKPASPMGGLQQIVENAQTFTNRVGVWEEAVFDAIDDISPTQVTESTMVKLKAAEEMLESQIEASTRALKRVRTNIRVVQKIIDAIPAAQKPEVVVAAAAKAVAGKKSKKGKTPAEAPAAAPAASPKTSSKRVVAKAKTGRALATA